MSGKPMHVAFDNAAQTVKSKNRWCRKRWRTQHGRKCCGLQAVMSELGIEGSINPMGLPVAYLRVLNSVLADNPEYRRIRARIVRKSTRTLAPASIAREAFIQWHDADDRRRQEVVDVLEAAAAVAKTEWQRKKARRAIRKASRAASAAPSLRPVLPLTA